MNRYFSFQRMITTSFVRGLYVLGFVLLTSGAIALIVWSGLQLHDARIERALGWRYVIIGASALVVGNLIWRVFCELWIVLFGIHDRLASIEQNLSMETAEQISIVPAPTKEPTPALPMEARLREATPRGAGVLGLS